MPVPGNLLTTAMAVMPHTDVDRALETALSVDIPFWPQLPNYNYYEDMYVQAAEHFPGILLDTENRTLQFSIHKFVDELEATLAHFEEPGYFDISKTYSVVYHRFLGMDLSDRAAVRGQLEGPVSFGLNILDQDQRPIIFDDTVRPFMLEIMAKRINIQLQRLKALNPNAFMFVDEPGLQFLFSALSGYSDLAAKNDLDLFFSMVDRPRGIHLCGNPDWDFLLGLDLDIISMDIYSNGEVFSNYAAQLKRFLDRGGIIVWGIVPTNMEPFARENIETLADRLTRIWFKFDTQGIDVEYLLSRSLLSPATCCLVNTDREKTVEAAFQTVNGLSQTLRAQFQIE